MNEPKKKSLLFKGDRKPCDGCGVVVGINEPHLTKDICIMALQQMLVGQQKLTEAIKQEMRGRTMMLWYFVKKRGGETDVNVAEIRAVPKDAYLDVAMDKAKGIYHIEAKRRSLNPGKDPLEGGEAPAAGSA